MLIDSPVAARERFRGKVVLITGATSGIGRAAAVAFAGEGARVGFCGRREQLGEEVEADIRRSGGEAVYVRGDVRVESQVKAFVDRVASRYGRLDVAFDNAGIGGSAEPHAITLESSSRRPWRTAPAGSGSTPSCRAPPTPPSSGPRG
ncbi:SDR family NAD(P)-dependent oxidoreductase [Nonomuraea sp. MTCD27]|uniref:SDR family NAD(P)-dependent oxidoreductase n=1 Tax=Nonomuraea sp. MTCD27 TaxID=1676747 RepID=UPI0035BF8755